MSVGFKVDGFRDMERALAGLKRGTSKAVVRRALKKVLKPVAEAADASMFQIAVTSKLSPRQRAAARGDFIGSVVSMYVGPIDDEGRGSPHAHLIEFGTGPRRHKSGKFVGAVMPDPFMRPAWDANKHEMLEHLKREIWAEIQKTLDRAAAKDARAGRH